MTMWPTPLARMLKAGFDMTLTLWHNPRCSKSRQTLALLQEKGLNPAVRLMLADPPDAAEITKVAGLLGVALLDITRTGEPLFKSLGLAGADESTLLDALAQNPILIQRPILVTKTSAAIGRPPEAVLSIL